VTEFRVLPQLEEETEFFWTSGRDGRLRILRCGSCSYYLHPPGPICPRCRSRELAPQPVSGRAVLHSYTVNHQQWAPGPTTPYAIALVTLAEQDDVRLTTNLVNVDPGDIRIGMELQVAFEDRDPVYLPLFEPAEPTG
jgi:uncharacterized OB-fold protein